MGPDIISAEALKSHIKVTEKLFYIQLKKICEEGQVLKDWEEEYLFMISKKGGLRECEDYRSITLLSIT